MSLQKCQMAEISHDAWGPDPPEPAERREGQIDWHIVCWSSLRVRMATAMLLLLAFFTIGNQDEEARNIAPLNPAPFCSSLRPLNCTTRRVPPSAEQSPDPAGNSCPGLSR